MESVHDRYDSLKDRAERDFPESWIPSDADPILVGEFVRLDSGTTRFGDCPVVVIRTKDGTERSLWVLHAALRGQFKSARPKPGELVAAKWLGKKEGREGQQYDAWRVVVARVDTEPDWDSIAEVGDFDESPRSEW